MELAIFFVLVAVIFGSVVVYFKGTFPYVLGLLRVANALEGVSMVNPRLGSFDFFEESSLGTHVTPWKYVHKVNSINEFALLTSHLDEALPSTLEETNACVASVAFDPGSCSFSEPHEISLDGAPLCPSPALVSCANLESSLILSARGCVSGDTGRILLAVLYPRIPEDSYDKCSVLEVGLTRAVY